MKLTLKIGLNIIAILWLIIANIYSLSTVFEFISAPNSTELFIGVISFSLLIITDLALGYVFYLSIKSIINQLKKRIN